MPYDNPTGLPSVTEIINPFLDTSWFTDEHTQRGEAVHEAAAAHLQGLFVPALDPAHRPYFESFKKWSGNIIDILFIEERLTDKQLGYTGQPDAVVRLKGDGLECFTLADWKTSQAYAKWWRLQYAGYKHLVKSVKNIGVQRGVAVRLKNDGTGALVDEHKNSQADWNYFVSHLNAFRFHLT